MERKFYPENFENFLKGHADQFKLTPSKKVWHGIYNDLHPGRRWPSIAMSMVLLFTLVTIGHLNTNNGHTSRIYNVPHNTVSLYNHLFPPVHADTRNAPGKTDATNAGNESGITTSEDAINDLPILALTANQPSNTSNKVSILTSTNDAGSDHSLLNNNNEIPAVNVIEKKITQETGDVTRSSAVKSISEQDQSMPKNGDGEGIKALPDNNKSR